MPPSFRKLTLVEFAELLARFPFTRRVTQVHMHHTWRPNHAQYRGHDSVVAMWKHHTQVNGWSDIAQHLTIGPDGSLWTGRNWNAPPASSGGANGTRDAGPFMFEMVGDFDRGRDPFGGAQRAAVLEVIARVQLRFGLAADALAFHRMLGSPKTCPGNAIDFQVTVAAVREERRRLEQRPRTLAEGTRARAPFSDAFLAESVTSARAVDDALRALTTAAPAYADPPDAEPAEERMGLEAMAQLTGEPAPATRAAPTAARATRGGEPPLAPQELAALRPHVVNLTQGRFSSTGQFRTSQGDVDALFDQHLPAALEAARARGAPLDVVLWAHGGLVGESSGLRIAHKHCAWWRRHDVYPIYFVWETGLWGTIRQLLTNARQRMPAVGTRDLWDRTTDPLVERAARALGGEKIWGGMKWSAEQASAPGGGARYVADRLGAFAAAHGDALRMHAVGHSAGSIFHAHFLPAAFDAGVPRVESLHLLAPAIRVDAFKRQLLPHLTGDDAAVRRFATFTMQQDWERADSCHGVYRKSLLYLVSRAFEAEDEAAILGLEESLRGDADLRALFALGPATAAVPAAAGEMVWAVSEASDGTRASTSRTHGGFDDDPPTLHSLLRRVRGLGDGDPITAYAPAAARAADADEVEWPESLGFLAALGGGAVPAPSVTAPSMTAPSMPEPPAPLAPIGTAPAAGAQEEREDEPLVFGGAAEEEAAELAAEQAAGGTMRPSDPTPSRSGRRVALCVGINAYPDAPLAGCVADARLWARTLRARGFDDVTELHDGEATRDRLLRALRALVRGRRPGDVVVFQFAGHGTQLDDTDGDERRDEALCAVDYADGGFVVDDDVRRAFTDLPAGVNLTCFVDCCHSATVTRMAGATPAAPAGTDVRARYLPRHRVTAEMVGRFQARRAEEGDGTRSAPAERGPATMKEITFSACRAEQVAYESDGQGDFTRHAVAVLGASDLGRLTNVGFLARVYRGFGANPRQEPTLDCAPANRTRGLLHPLADAAARAPDAAELSAAGGAA
jgi:hypothetical protein